MYNLKLKDLTTNEVFTKTFPSPYLLNQYKNKVKRGKKIIVLASDY